MFESTMDFLNTTIWYIPNIADMRVFHVLVMSVCAYCIIDELRVRK